MKNAPYILGDWGTSNLRLYLCGMDGSILGEKTGPGIAEVREKAGDIFLSIIEDWTNEHGPMQATLSGMVGANIGWREIPYLECPLAISEVSHKLESFRAEDHQITIIPGMRAINPLGAPDVMRGEETQIFGAMQLLPQLREGDHLFCLPGTHTKWVKTKNGRLETFLTAVSGELFGLFHSHSVLLDKTSTPPSEITPAFEAGLSRTRTLNETALLHLFFEVRSQQLTGALSAEEAVAYLSGLITGRDVSGALATFGEAAISSCILVGADMLTNLYNAAFKLHNISVETLSGQAASIAGLKAVHTSLQEA